MNIFAMNNATKPNGVFGLSGPNFPIALQNEMGETLLHVAVKKGQSDLCKALIQRGCPVNAANVNGETPLHYACQIGNAQIVYLLLEYGAHANVLDVEAEAPLHHAIREGRLEIVGILLKAGADINLSNEEGETPLHLAASIGDASLVKAILELSTPDLTYTDNYGNTPAMEAMFNGYSEIAALLGGKRELGVKSQPRMINNFIFNHQNNFFNQHHSFATEQIV